MQPNRSWQRTFFYALPFVAMITVLLVLLLIWVTRNLREEQMSQLRETASALVQQIILTRSWNAEHGGVYVERDPRTQPNPYLRDPDRDIVSVAGKRYTKLNPAYMTRQIAELSQQRHGNHFSLTSLRPLNPANQPDAWEKDALLAMERGAGEQMAVAAVGPARLFRFIAPLLLEAPCLRCHADQHYRLGDAMGGISVSLPMRRSDRIHEERAAVYLRVTAGVWAVLIGFIILVSWTESRRIAREMTHRIELTRLKSTIELAGAVAHEIRQPLTVLMSHGHIIQDSLGPDHEISRSCDAMIRQCGRINEAVTRLEELAEYKTKPYIGSERIVDLGIDRTKFES